MPNGWPQWLQFYTVAPYVRTPEEILPDSPTQRETGSARPRPEHKRVWASLAQSPEEVIREMFDEAARRDPQGQKRWVALVDGNLPQIGYAYGEFHEQRE